MGELVHVCGVQESALPTDFHSSILEVGKVFWPEHYGTSRDLQSSLEFTVLHNWARGEVRAPAA